MSNAVASRSSTLPSRASSTFIAPWGGRYPEVVPADARHSEIIEVAGLGGGLRVLRTFYVRVDPDNDGYIATSPITMVYEMGESWKDALRNFIVALRDHFRWLTEIEESLSPSVQEELYLLRQYLQLGE